VAQLTKHKRFQRLFELSEGDVRLPKLFRQTVPQCCSDDMSNYYVLS